MKGLFLFLVKTGFVLCFLASFGVVGGYLYLNAKLPAVSPLKDAPLQVPLKVYSKDKKLIAEYGYKRRSPLQVGEIPEQLIHAIIATEDQRFYDHYGVDLRGLARAAIHLFSTGKRAQGGSTITMQVARNFFLTPERTYTRKFNEILLALKIERTLSKDEILTLYLNKIFLGHRAYGIAAAAQVYYGTTVDELSLPQMAMLAGLPKAPSKINPITNPRAAKRRRNHVLGRMFHHGYIDEQDYKRALRTPLSARYHGLKVELKAPYIAEMVRKDMIYRYGKEKAYTQGFSVYTTIHSHLQSASDQALRTALSDYDKRHGYRGHKTHWEYNPGQPAEHWQEKLLELPKPGGLLPALVIQSGFESALCLLADGTTTILTSDSYAWATSQTNNQINNSLFSVGDVIYIHDQTPITLAQVPQVNGALVALRPADGAILSLSGGFDYQLSKYNRATQAKRQPGSNFKPFIYSAAIEQGMTPATMINDAPVVFNYDEGLENSWRPENYSGKFFGPTRLRTALVKSRNLVSIRLLKRIGIDNAIKFTRRFGFEGDSLPRDLSLALGSGIMSPIEVAKGYAVFANGGSEVQPYLIERIEAPNGKVLFHAEPASACTYCESPITIDDDQFQTQQTLSSLPTNLAPRIISPENAYIMTSMMRDVIQHGTGRKAKILGRKDIAGKTGTTNDQTDAWFSGYHKEIVATAWVGFDKPTPLGNRETGGRAALPMWIDYMRTALQGIPESQDIQPPGIVTIKIDKNSGLLANANHTNTMFEIFDREHVPTKVAPTKQIDPYSGHSQQPVVPEQLF